METPHPRNPAAAGGLVGPQDDREVRGTSILPHPALRLPLHAREAFVAEFLLLRARELARDFQLTDVAGVLGSASNLAATYDWEGDR